MRQAEFEYLDLQSVVRIHETMITRHGGSNGIKDIGLVESALLAPRQTFDGLLLRPTAEEQCASLWFGFVKNHGFVDGNKRVGLAVADIFLKMNGFRFKFDSSRAESLTVLIASSQISLEGLTEIVKSSIERIS